VLQSTVSHGHYKVQKSVATAKMVTLEPRGGLLQVQENWQEHLPYKSSSCTPFLEDNLAGDNGGQSIHRRRC
jgi:hypothetical protein